MKLNEDIFEIDIPEVDPTPELTIDDIEQETVATPEENGVATLLINSISDTWNKINDYNSIISTISSSDIENAEEITSVVKDVVDEEHENVGKLMAALTSISPNTENVEVGQEEADMKLSEDLDMENPDFTVDVVHFIDDDLEESEFVETVGVTLPELISKFGKNTVDQACKGVVKEHFNNGKMNGSLLHDLVKIVVSEKAYAKNRKNPKYDSWGLENFQLVNDSLFPSNIEYLQQYLGKKLLPPTGYKGRRLESLKEDFENSKAGLLSDVLGRSISTSDENYIYDEWRAFYNDPESFRDSVVADMVIKGLDTRPVNESKRKMRIKESLTEELRDATEDEYIDMMQDVYNALADVAFKYSKKGIAFTSNQWDDAYEWWGDRFFIEDFHESLKEALHPVDAEDMRWYMYQAVKNIVDKFSPEVTKSDVKAAMDFALEYVDFVGLDESLKEDIENLEDVNVEFNPVMQDAKEHSKEATKHFDDELEEIGKEFSSLKNEQEVIGAEKQEVPKMPEEPRATLDESLFKESVYDFFDDEPLFLEVHVVSPYGVDKVISSESSLEDAEDTLKDVIWDLLDAPMISASEKIHALDDMYIFNLDTNDRVDTEEMKRFIKQAKSRLLRQIKK